MYVHYQQRTCEKSVDGLVESLSAKRDLIGGVRLPPRVPLPRPSPASSTF